MCFTKKTLCSTKTNRKTNFSLNKNGLSFWIRDLVVFVEVKNRFNLFWNSKTLRNKKLDTTKLKANPGVCPDCDRFSKNSMRRGPDCIWLLCLMLAFLFSLLRLRLLLGIAGYRSHSQTNKPRAVNRIKTIRRESGLP